MAEMRRIEDEFNCPSCGTHIKREVGVFTDQALREEIKRLRATIEEMRNLGGAAPEVVAQSFFSRECQEAFSAFLPENRNAGMIISTLARLTELIRRARIDGANETKRLTTDQS